MVELAMEKVAWPGNRSLHCGWKRQGSHFSKCLYLSQSTSNPTVDNSYTPEVGGGVWRHPLPCKWSEETPLSRPKGRAAQLNIAIVNIPISSMSVTYLCWYSKRWDEFVVKMPCECIKPRRLMYSRSLIRSATYVWNHVSTAHATSSPVN